MKFPLLDIHQSTKSMTKNKGNICFTWKYNAIAKLLNNYYEPQQNQTEIED